MWIFYQRYSPKIDAVRNTDETKVAIANSEQRIAIFGKVAE
jgi:hypothetical protein